MTRKQFLRFAWMLGFVSLISLSLGLAYAGWSASLSARTLVLTSDTWWANEVAVEGGYAYIPDQNADNPAQSGLRVLNVSNPNNPTQRGFCITHEPP